MADLNIRPPLETKMHDANGNLTQAWRQFFGTLRERLNKALANIEVAVDAEVENLNITGKFSIDDVTVFSEFRDLIARDADLEDITASSLVTTGDASIGGDAAVSGDLDVTGALDVTGNISGADIDGDALTGDSLSVTGEVAGATADITGDADVGGDLDVVGEVAGATLAITSNATVGGTLIVDSDTTIKGANDTDAIFNLFADKGDDNADKWRIRISKTANIAYLETYASGAWVAKWTVDASGDLTVANDIILPADNDKTFYGTGKDASVYYDGTDMNIKTDEVAASDLQIHTGADKTLELQTVVWDDLRVPMENTQLTPTKSEPIFTAFIDGTYLYAFKPTNAADESLHFVAQLPHGYKLGTNLYPHVHWSPSTTDTGNVEWELEYLLAKDGATFPGTALAATATDAADGTVGKHQRATLTTIDGSGIDSVSAMIVCRLTRRADLETDTFTGSAFVLEFDFHYQIDTLGSRQELVK